MVALAAELVTAPRKENAMSVFAIRASADPHVMLRVAGLFAQRDIIPEQICCRRAGDYQVIDIEVALDNDRAAEILLQKIRSMVHVERANLVGK